MPLFADMTQPPNEALRHRMPSSTPEPVLRLLFARLADFNVDGSAPLLHEVRRLIGTKIRQPKTWHPYSASVAITAHDAGDLIIDMHKVYVATVLRVNILEAYCEGLRMRQDQRYRDMLDQPHVEQPLDELDALSFYMHGWLDAHLLLAVAFERLGVAPVDRHAWTTAALAAYEPSANTVFHEGELPNLVSRIESCSFFSEATTASSKRRDPIAHMLSKSIPHRCVVRDVISIIEQACVQDDTVMYLFTALMAASLLGIYRHARSHPALRERLRIYFQLFFVPPASLAAAIQEAAKVRGRKTTLLAEYANAFKLPPENTETTVPGNYEQQRQNDGLPTTATATGVTRIDWLRRRQVYAFIASVSHRTSTRIFSHQKTVVNVLREYLVFAVRRFIPHLYDELVTRTGWARWQASVVSCMDAMRAKPPGVSILRTLNTMHLPSKALYQVERESFVSVLSTACTVYLDSGQGRTNDADGSERTLDAAFTAEVDVCLRFLVNCYARTPSHVQLLPVTQVPRTWEEFEADFVPRGRFPLLPFHATMSVIREYKAAASNYRKSPSPAIATGFVRFLAEDASLYQLMLVRAFAQAQIDRGRVYAFPLSKHLADKQASVLRERLSIMDDEQPLPIHLLTTFVCRHCREFRGALIESTVEASRELPMFGSELVAMTTTTIEQRATEQLRRNGFPRWPQLVKEARAAGTSLFDWYRANSSIDGDKSVYTPDPIVFSAPQDASERCEKWLEERDRDRTDHPFFVPDQPLTTDTWKAPIVQPSGTPTVFGSLELPPFEHDDVYERFQDRWAELNGRPFIVGHRSNDSRDETVEWTCSSRKYKGAERKTRQTTAAVQKVQDSITPQQRASAMRSANQKRRHDMRCYHLYSMCSRSRLLAVSMLGYGLRLDNHIIVACCACLGYTQLKASHWYDDSLLCTRCWKSTQDGVTGSLGSFGLSTAVKCLQCRTVLKTGDRFHSTTVYDDVVNRFVRVYFCAPHSKKKSWIFGSPNYQALTTVNVGIRAGWGTLRSWDSTRDYARSVVAFARVGLNEADEHEMAEDEAEEQQLMEAARKLLGSANIDDDTDDDGDDDGGEVDDDGKKKKKKKVKKKKVPGVVAAKGNGKRSAAETATEKKAPVRKRVNQ